jgi:quercetin dioxygenase-like cupin family protein
MQRPPDADLGPARMWVVERGDAVQCMLIEIDGVLPLHLHPDGVHRMYVLDGRIRVSIGEHTQDLGPGDYIRIPRGAKHRIERVGIGTAHYASVDTPPVEAARIVWIEAAPRR